MGTTGEAVTMTAAERRGRSSWRCEVAKGGCRWSPARAATTRARPSRTWRGAREAGADGALVVTPYYNKPTQAGLVEHFRRDRQGRTRASRWWPTTCPAAPGWTCCPRPALRLCELPEVVALKEATGNLARALEIRERCGERLTLLSGDDFTVLPFIASRRQGRDLGLLQRRAAR